MDKKNIAYEINAIDKNGKKYHVDGVISFANVDGIPTILETDMNRIPKKKVNKVECIIDGNEVVFKVNVDN